MQRTPHHIHWTIPGALATGGACGIKADGASDLALLHFPEGATWTAVTTRHHLRAAPVRRLETQRARGGPLRAVVVNSGNANACTGPAGARTAEAMAAAAAQVVGCSPEEVAVASTGVIGVPLDPKPIATALPRLRATLTESGWLAAAEAIRTTDAFPKLGYQAILDDEGVMLGAVGGIAKGAGMIAPEMATMLAFLVTDLAIPADRLQIALRNAVAESFNRIIVDGDRSTNDVVLLAATGASETPVDAVVLAHFEAALSAVAHDLAEQIVADGEGARRVARILVNGATDHDAAQRIARAIGSSLLVKTALFGGDPNWGRIAAAAGSTEVPVREEELVVEIGEVVLFDRGHAAGPEAEARAAAHLQGERVEIHVHVGHGPGVGWVLVSDIGHPYVELNAHYRT